MWLVATDLLQTPNTTLTVAAPLPHSGLHLPQLQSEQFGNVLFGYGDLFVAGLLGAVLAREGRRQWPIALLTLFLAGPVRPAVLLRQRAARDRAGGRGADRRGGVGVAGTPAGAGSGSLAVAGPAAAQWGSSPVEAGGRDSSASEVIASLPRAASSSTSVASSADLE